MKTYLIELMKSLASTFTIGFLAGILRVLIHYESDWKKRVSVVIMCFLLANVARIALMYTDLSLAYQTNITIAVAFLGKELLETLIKVSPALMTKYLESKVDKYTKNGTDNP